MQENFVVVVLDKNPNSLKIIKSYLEDIDFISEIKLYEDYSKGIEEIKKIRPVVIVDVSDFTPEMENVLNNIKDFSSNIIIISVDYSTDIIIKSLRAGARECLPKPIIKEDLLKTLSIIKNHPEIEETETSKIISVYSNKGGIGKTTLAINLAAELSKVTKDKVALIDLNLQLGDISTFLNINPPFDVNFVMKKLTEKDEHTILQAFEKYKDSSLYVLADPPYIEQSEGITPIQIQNLFNALKKVFSYIIIDMSSGIDANTLKILDSSDFILFTSIVNIPAIRNAQRCLNIFRSRKYPKNKVKIIINRYMENDEIKIEDIENTLGEKVYWKIPNNYFTIMEAINKGVVISEINTSSNICNSFKDFATKLSNDIIEQSIIEYN